MPVEGYCGARVGKQRHLETARYHPHAEPKESQTPLFMGLHLSALGCDPHCRHRQQDTSHGNLSAGLERSLLPLSPGRKGTEL